VALSIVCEWRGSEASRAASAAAEPTHPAAASHELALLQAWLAAHAADFHGGDAWASSFLRATAVPGRIRSVGDELKSTAARAAVRAAAAPTTASGRPMVSMGSLPRQAAVPAAPPAAAQAEPAGERARADDEAPADHEAQSQSPPQPGVPKLSQPTEATLGPDDAAILSSTDSQGDSPVPAVSASTSWLWSLFAAPTGPTGEPVTRMAESASASTGSASKLANATAAVEAAAPAAVDAPAAVEAAPAAAVDAPAAVEAAPAAAVDAPAAVEAAPAAAVDAPAAADDAPAAVEAAPAASQAPIAAEAHALDDDSDSDDSDDEFSAFRSRAQALKDQMRAALARESGAE